MKICKNCGSELNENEKFCPNCGVSQEEYSAVQYPDIQQDTDSHDAAYSAESDSRATDIQNALINATEAVNRCV